MASCDPGTSFQALRELVSKLGGADDPPKILYSIERLDDETSNILLSATGVLGKILQTTIKTLAPVTHLYAFELPKEELPEIPIWVDSGETYKEGLLRILKKCVDKEVTVEHLLRNWCSIYPGADKIYHIEEKNPHVKLHPEICPNVHISLYNRIEGVYSSKSRTTIDLSSIMEHTKESTEYFRAGPQTFSLEDVTKSPEKTCLTK